MKSGDISTNFTEVKRTIRECDNQWYTNTLNNLTETDKFVETQKLAKLTQEEIQNLNRFLTSKGIK